MQKTENESKKFPFSELQERYGINRTEVSNRLKALNIKPERCRNKSYITLEELHLMDDLDAHLKAGGTTSEFVHKGVATGQNLVPGGETNLAHDNTEPEDETIYVEQSLREIVGEKADSAGAEELPKIDEAERSVCTGNSQASHAAVTEEAISSNISNQIEQDITELDTQAQYIAAHRVIYRNAAAAYYEATEEFTIPGFKQQVERSKQYAAKFTKKFEELYSLENFLSRSRLAHMLPSGRSGSETFLNCSNSQSEKLDADESSD